MPFPLIYCFQKQGLTVVTLLFAAVAGDTAALQRLHLQGVDMAAADYDGRTALHLAAAEGHLQCVIFLLDICGVRPDPADRWPPHMHLNYADRYDNTLTLGDDVFQVIILSPYIMMYLLQVGPHAAAGGGAGGASGCRGVSTHSIAHRGDLAQIFYIFYKYF